MSRIAYNPSTIGGDILAEAVSSLIEVQGKVARVKALADQVSGGGATTAALEGSPEFGVGTGAGQSFYDALANLASNLGVITAPVLAQIDQGR